MVREEEMQVRARQKNGRRNVLGIQLGPERVFAGRGGRDPEISSQRRYEGFPHSGY